MNRILIAAVAAFAFVGAAAAQQAPVLSGDYSANVLNGYNGTADAGVDFVGQASIGGDRAFAPAATDAGGNVSTIWSGNYSGK